MQFVARPTDRDWDRTLETDIETSVYSLPLKASESEAQLADSCLAFIGFVWPELLAGFIAPRSRRRWQSRDRTDDWSADRNLDVGLKCSVSVLVSPTPNVSAPNQGPDLQNILR